MVLVVFSMTTAASEEISEAWGHPEMELVDMVPDASTAALWSASSADMGTWKRREAKDQEPEKLSYLLLFHSIMNSCIKIRVSAVMSENNIVTLFLTVQIQFCCKYNI